MNHHKFLAMPAMMAAIAVASTIASAAPFTSGSTGTDGAFAPTVDTVVALPESGILNYTTINIPAGVTVTFTRNPANTAVMMLASGSVKIAGAIDVSGKNSPVTHDGAAANGMPGHGGAGGFDGGRGGVAGAGNRAGNGFGPGGGTGGSQGSKCGASNVSEGGGGGGFAGPGQPSQCLVWNFTGGIATGGTGYGSPGMLPLIGGSGGGGGAGSGDANRLPGSGGGGGGGALMIVASGTVELTGAIAARGGNAGNIANGECNWTLGNGGAGGGGSGGAVRIIAAGFTGDGKIDVAGGIGGCRVDGTNLQDRNSGGNGSSGRVHVEVVQQGSFSQSMIPGVAITRVGGVDVGNGEVSLPIDQGNPVEVVISASGVPVGSAVKITSIPAYADKVTADASALAGTLQASTSTGSINIPSGSSVLMASTTYALTIAQGQALSKYAQGERVEKVSLAAILGGGEQQVTLITVSGKEYPVPAAVLAMLPG